MTRPYSEDLRERALAHHNPLALCCAVRHFRPPASDLQTAIFAAIAQFLARVAPEPREHRHLRWAAIGALAEAEGPGISELLKQSGSSSWDALRGRYRNGDLLAGIGMCLQVEPGVSVRGHNAFLDHVKARFGANLVKALADLLSKASLNDHMRAGALRLAGHIGEPALANAIRECWRVDGRRDLGRLADYLWAATQCIDDRPESLLGPMCDCWAELPGDSEGNNLSLRQIFAVDFLHGLRSKLSPTAARYLMQRAEQPELRSSVMAIFQGMDQPEVLEFFVRDIAAKEESIEGKCLIWPTAFTAARDWESRQERSGRPMSQSSRDRLFGLWTNRANGKHLRSQAFRFWAASRGPDDLAILRTISLDDPLADSALWQRIRRGDPEAAPAAIEKMKNARFFHWWQIAKSIPADILAPAIDATLRERGRTFVQDGQNAVRRADIDAYVAQSIMSLPSTKASALLEKHWDQISTSHYYVMAALNLGTPDLLKRVAEVLRTASDPAAILNFAFSRVDRSQGIHRVEQVEGILPYLDLLGPGDICELWVTCNEHGWLALRRQHLDARLSAEYGVAEFVNQDRILKKLDELAADKRRWLEGWLDDYLKAGATVDEIIETIGSWLRARMSLEALEVACGAVVYIGQRRHLPILTSVEIQPANEAAAIIADAECALRRRTLYN